jgi:hypothetical protein
VTLGMLVVDEQRYPIVHIDLAGSHIQFWARLPVPVTLPRASEVRVHAPNGALVLCARWRLDGAQSRLLGKLRPGDTATVCFPLEINEVKGWPS